MKIKRSISPEERQRCDILVEKISGCAYRVSNTLGSGFLESVYERALVYEFQQAGLHFRQPAPPRNSKQLPGEGEFAANFLVEGCILLHLYAVIALSEMHEAHCVEDLVATGLPVCLLVNFGARRIQVKRIYRDEIE